MTPENSPPIDEEFPPLPQLLLAVSDLAYYCEHEVASGHIHGRRLECYVESVARLAKAAGVSREQFQSAFNTRDCIYSIQQIYGDESDA